MAYFDDEGLLHYGVLGMKWGIRKDRRKGGPRKSTSAEAKEKEKRGRKPLTTKQKVAIAAGTAIVIGGAATAFVLLNKGQPSPEEFAKAVDVGKKIVEQKASQEPTDLIWLSRGKNIGQTFLRKGGIENFYSELEKSTEGLDSDAQDNFRRYGKNMEKVFASFVDPEGRKDFAGREVGHLVIIPPPLAKGINTPQDVRDKIWPLLRDEYQAFYEKSLKTPAELAAMKKT